MMLAAVTPPYPSLLPGALRDTALTVTSLADDAAPAVFDSFRQKCKEQIDRLRAELTAAGHARDVIEDACYAQCALLDEAALSSLKGRDRDAWEHEPLQVSEFQSHNAGEELIARIERRLAEPQPVLPLLAIFIAVLDLGFRGKFARDGHDARTALMRAVDGHLDRNRDTSGPVIVRPSAAPRWNGHLSPLGWVMLTCIATGIAYVAIDHWLTVSIAQMVR
jgi:type VI secretion system protein ImpK